MAGKCELCRLRQSTNRSVQSAYRLQVAHVRLPPAGLPLQPVQLLPRRRAGVHARHQVREGRRQSVGCGVHASIRSCYRGVCAHDLCQLKTGFRQGKAHTEDNIDRFGSPGMQPFFIASLSYWAVAYRHPCDYLQLRAQQVVDLATSRHGCNCIRSCFAPLPLGFPHHVATRILRSCV